MTDRLAIVGGRVVAPHGLITDGLVLCEAGRITFVGAAHAAGPEPGSQILDVTGQTVFPGFIDTHVHGSSGDDVMAHGAEGIRRVSRAQLRSGTTAYLPTTIAARHAELLRSIEDAIAAEHYSESAAEILGLHIEGPYINLKYKGAQPEEGIRDPDIDECRELLKAAAAGSRS